MNKFILIAITFVLSNCTTTTPTPDTPLFLNFLRTNNFIDEKLLYPEDTNTVYANSADSWINLNTFSPEGAKELKSFYIETFKAHYSLNISRQSFDIIKLPVLYKPLSKHRAQEIYNSFLVKFQDTQSGYTWILRPIEVDTGCDSQCLPVVFHLLYRSTANGIFEFYDIVQEPKRPLTKVGHQTLTNEDLNLIKKNLSIELPLQLTQWPSGHTTDLLVSGRGQTWTFLSPFVVSGGAYTSYRVYEAHRKTLAFLNHKPVYTFAAATDPVLDIFNQTDQPNISIELDNSFRKQPELLNNYRKISFATATWNVLSGITSESYSGLVKRYRFQISEECLFQSLILKTQRGQRFFLDSVGPKQTCPAMNYDLIKQSIRPTHKSHWDLPTFVPRYIVTNADLFLRILNESQNHPSTNRNSWIQEFLLRYPDKATLLKGKDKLQVNVDSRRDFLELRFANYFNKTETPFSIGFKTRNLSNTAESKATKPRIYVLMSATCPHCIDFFRTYKDSTLYKEHSEKVSFINLGTSLSDQSWLKDFCLASGWEQKECRRNLKQATYADAKTTKFLNEYKFTGTPHIIVTQQNGRLLISKFPLGFNEADKESSRNIFTDLLELLLSF